MIEKNSGIISVLSENKLVGVLTDWDVTAAVASDNRDVILEKIMTKDVITASPDFSILDIIRELEQYQISAMPVVDQGKVLGMVNSDLIAQRYFLEYLQTH
jgi:CBS domain-containing protein